MSYVRNHAGIYVPSQVGRLDMVGQAKGAAVAQLPPWAPTSHAEIEQWAADQADVWHRPEVKGAIEDARGQITDALGQGDSDYGVPTGQVMDGDQTLDWVINDVEKNGFPKNADDAAALSVRFLDAQGQQMGFHPGFLGEGVRLVTSSWPGQSPEAAAEWGRWLGDAVMSQYGISLPSNWEVQGLAKAAASAACLQVGVPFVGVVTTGIDSLWDGKLTYEEIGSIVVAVGSSVGAAVGQMFGIPAPIGAFVGAIATEIVWGWASDLFGWGPDAAELRGRAWNEMLKARAAMMEQCLDVATTTWASYNTYWNDVETNLRSTLNAAASELGEGVRAFGEKRLVYVTERSKWGLPKFQFLPWPIHEICERPEGCLYYSAYGDRPGGYVRTPPASPEMVHQVPTHANFAPVPNYFGARLPDGTYSPNAALAFYGAKRYTTPFEAELDRLNVGSSYVLPMDRPCWSGGRMSGSYVECWPQALHSDYEYLEHLSYIRSALRPEDLEMCRVPEWADYIMASLVQVGPALAFVMNDVSATMAQVAAEAEVRARMQGDLDEYQLQRRIAVQAAQERRDILRMRRDKASREARLRYGMLAVGTGGVAGVLLSKMLGAVR